MDIGHGKHEQAAVSDRVYRKIAARLLPLFMIAYILNYLDRSNIGFAKLEFQQDLGISERAFGLGAGLFYLTYSLFEIPSNLLLARIGARLTLLRIMVGWGLCATAFALMQSPLHYYILRLMLGAAEAGLFPGILLMISFWIPVRRRAQFTAAFMSAMALSSIIGGPLSGLIMSTMDGVWGQAGWRWMFVIEGIPSIAMGIVIFCLLADSPAKARWLSSAEKAALQAEFVAENAERLHTHGGHADFSSALRDHRIFALGLMATAMVASAAGLQFWMPTVIRHAGVQDILWIGFLSAVPPLIGIIVQQLVARRSDAKGEQRWHCALAAFVSAAGWLLLPIVNQTLLPTMIALVLIAAGFFAATGPFWAMPSRYLTGKAAAGGIALISMIGGVGSFVSPTIVGWLATHTGVMTWGYIYYGALMILGPMTMLWATKPAAR